MSYAPFNVQLVLTVWHLVLTTPPPSCPPRWTSAMGFILSNGQTLEETGSWERPRISVHPLMVPVRVAVEAALGGGGGAE